MDKLLNQVVTFAEACEILEQNQGYMKDLVRAGKLIEGVDFRKAGRISLITRCKVERIGLANKKFEGNKNFDEMAEQFTLIKAAKDIVEKFYEVVDIARSKGIQLKTYGAAMEIIGQPTYKDIWTYRDMLKEMNRYCINTLHLKEDILADLRTQVELSGLADLIYLSEDSDKRTKEEHLISDAFLYFTLK